MGPETPGSSAPVRALVGCSGWSYKDWRGTVYPENMPSRQWFSQYVKLFGTVELNSTFYRLPPPETFSLWRGEAPEGFVFAVKVNSYGTHRLKLLRPSTWLTNYLERAVLLGPALGPNLVQLPPHWKRDTSRLRDFLQFATAASDRLQASFPAGGARWAVEFRDPSWLDEPTYEVLRDNGAALCCHDLVEGHPWLLTARWAYVRFHGPQGSAAKYAGEYGVARLRPPAEVIRAWLEQGCDVYAYFNNDVGGAAVRDATSMAGLLA
ncbi:MAG TPA: DUF72 domain-containing protein [Acidimicrobiales bacterium]|nr:DUF72 domain-containing protein [Acidimicrobiales bacterium]